MRSLGKETQIYHEVIDIGSHSARDILADLSLDLGISHLLHHLER